MLENFGIAVASISSLSGVFLLYNGITSSGMNQLLGGAALLSGGLVTAVSSQKANWSGQELSSAIASKIEDVPRRNTTSTEVLNI
jgi:hypothetical protein